MMAGSESSAPNVLASSANSFSRLCCGMCSNAAVKLKRRSATPVRKCLCFARRDVASSGTTRDIV